MLTGVKTAMNDFSIGTALLIFSAYVLIDALYAYWTLMIVKKEPWKAGLSAGAIYTLTMIGTLQVVDDWRYIFPIALGSFVGTFGITWWNKKYGKQV